MRDGFNMCLQLLEEEGERQIPVLLLLRAVIGPYCPGNNAPSLGLVRGRRRKRDLSLHVTSRTICKTEQQLQAQSLVQILASPLTSCVTLASWWASLSCCILAIEGVDRNGTYFTELGNAELLS